MKQPRRCLGASLGAVDAAARLARPVEAPWTGGRLFVASCRQHRVEHARGHPHCQEQAPRDLLVRMAQGIRGPRAKFLFGDRGPFRCLCGGLRHWLQIAHDAVRGDHRFYCRVLDYGGLAKRHRRWNSLLGGPVSDRLTASTQRPVNSQCRWASVVCWSAVILSRLATAAPVRLI